MFISVLQRSKCQGQTITYLGISLDLVDGDDAEQSTFVFPFSCSLVAWALKCSTGGEHHRRALSRPDLNG